MEEADGDAHSGQAVAISGALKTREFLIREYPTGPGQIRVSRDAPVYSIYCVLLRVKIFPHFLKF